MYSSFLLSGVGISHPRFTVKKMRFKITRLKLPAVSGRKCEQSRAEEFFFFLVPGDLPVRGTHLPLAPRILAASGAFGSSTFAAGVTTAPGHSQQVMPPLLAPRQARMRVSVSVGEPRATESSGVRQVGHEQRQAPAGVFRRTW